MGDRKGIWYKTDDNSNDVNMIQHSAVQRIEWIGIFGAQCHLDMTGSFGPQPILTEDHITSWHLHSSCQSASSRVYQRRPAESVKLLVQKKIVFIDVKNWINRYTVNTKIDK